MIRSYTASDSDAVRSICLETADARLAGNPLTKNSVLRVFCDYYIEQEPQNCFVAVDEAGVAMGYILCAENFQQWRAEFNRRYLKKSLNPITKMMGKATVEELANISEQYPAHLHINLRPQCQRQGLGTRLLDALIAHLHEKDVSGLCLSVGKNNQKGKSFYTKYGFAVLRECEQDVLMGIRIPCEHDSRGATI